MRARCADRAPVRSRYDPSLATSNGKRRGAWRPVVRLVASSPAPRAGRDARGAHTGMDIGRTGECCRYVAQRICHDLPPDSWCHARTVPPRLARAVGTEGAAARVSFEDNRRRGRLRERSRTLACIQGAVRAITPAMESQFLIELSLKTAIPCYQEIYLRHDGLVPSPLRSSAWSFHS